MLVCLCFVVWFFFFKQKTAYEMRISDWSSDVCSSDLRYWDAGPAPPVRCPSRQCRCRRAAFAPAPRDRRPGVRLPATRCPIGRRARYNTGYRDCRSEEHTSELQSLMRISYAVFCLKKKIKLHQSSIQNTYHRTSLNHQP